MKVSRSLVKTIAGDKYQAMVSFLRRSPQDAWRYSVVLEAVALKLRALGVCVRRDALARRILKWEKV